MKGQVTNPLALAAVTVCMLLSCKTTPSLRQLVDTIPAKHLENYAFSREIDVVDRLNVSSDLVMSYLGEYDNPNGDYALYEPTETERALLGEYLGLLPVYYQKVLVERLVGIYFVENFIGSGMTDYVLSQTDEIYTILVLNPVVLEKDLSELLTYKENTIYRDENQRIKVEIDLSGEYLGLLYILIHECTHIVDYVDRFTPYIEPGIKILMGESQAASPFTSSYWLDYSEPKDTFTYKERLKFYSADEDKKISDTQMIDIYNELKNTPFVSLYSYLNWAEDLAEYCSIYHFTQNMGLTYTIRVVEQDTTLFEYEPFSNPRILGRVEKLDFLQE